MVAVSVRSLRVYAPAKLNLFLHVTGRLPNGYHTLQTAFVFLDLCDTLEFAPHGVGIRLPDDPTGSHEDNLILKAGRTLASRLFPLGDAPGVEVRLDKRIPWGAGLGGGSSDAASTLLALQRLWGRALPQEELLGLARSLGADVPVFVYGRAAWAEGIGEQLQGLDLPQGLYAVLLFPPFGVSTADVFRSPDLARNTAMRDLPSSLSASQESDWQQWLAGTTNDLWPVAAGLQPVLMDYLHLFTAVCTQGGATPWLMPRMSGSGSTLFALYRSPVEAAKIAEGLQEALAKDRSLSAARCLVSRVHLANDIFSGYT